MLNRFHRGLLFTAEPGAAGGDPNPGSLSSELKREITTIINEHFNAWQNSFTKKTLPAALGSYFDSRLPDLEQGIFDKIQAALPTEDELKQLELEGGDGEGGEGGNGRQYQLPPEVNAEILRLRKQAEEQNAKFAEMEEREQQSLIRAEQSDRQAQIQGFLNKYPFANDHSRNVAFEHFFNNADRDEETGDLVCGGLPIDKYVEDYMGNLPGLLASRPVGGAGSQPGGRPKAGPQIEDINGKMKPEERDAAWATAVAALPSGFINQGAGS